MNKTQKVNLMYPSNSDLFEFDTAIPMQTVQDIIKTVFPKITAGSEEYCDIWNILHDSVYCYDKENRSQGFLPLSSECLHTLRTYEQKVGFNVIFVPVFTTYQVRKERQYRKEFEELSELKKFEGFELEFYTESRNNGTEFETIKEMFI